MKKAIISFLSLIVGFICILLYTKEGMLLSKELAGNNITENLYDLSYINVNKGQIIYDIKFYNDDTLIVSYNDIKNENVGVTLYNIYTKEVIYNQSVSTFFYPKIMKFNDKSFALYDSANFILFESPTKDVKLIKPTELLSNKDTEWGKYNYIFYSKDRYYFTENAKLFKSDFNGENEIVLDLSDKYESIYVQILNNNLALIQCSQYDELIGETLLYDLKTNKILNSDKVKDDSLYIFDNISLSNHYGTNKVNVYQNQDEKYVDEFFLEDGINGEVINFANNKLVISNKTYYGEDEKQIYRIYSLKNGEMLFSDKLFDNKEYAFIGGDFSDNGDLAVMALGENKGEYYEEEKLDIFIMKLNKLSPIEREDSIYNDSDKLLKSIEEKYNINILIGKEALGSFPDFKGELLEEEDNILITLRCIENIFSKLPNGFIKEICSSIDENDPIGINFYITGKLSSTVENAVSNPSAYAYVDNDNKKNCIAIDGTMSASIIEENVSHELMHIIDFKMMKNSNVIEEWVNLLPEECKYNYSYENYQHNIKYTLEDSNNIEEIYFTNAYSKTFPIEDRAEIFKLLFISSDELPYQLTYPNIYKKAEKLCIQLEEYFESINIADNIYWEKFIN